MPGLRSTRVPAGGELDGELGCGRIIPQPSARRGCLKEIPG